MTQQSLADQREGFAASNAADQKRAQKAKIERRQIFASLTLALHY